MIPPILVLSPIPPEQSIFRSRHPILVPHPAIKIFCNPASRLDFSSYPGIQLTCSLARLLACSLARLLACSLARLLACSLARLLACSLARLLACSLARLLTCSFVHLLTCLLACSLARFACSLAGLLSASIVGY